MEYCDPYDDLETLQRFVCFVYTNLKSVVTVNDLRWELYGTKNVESEKITTYNMHT